METTTRTRFWDRLQDVLARPIGGGSRIVLTALTGLMVLSFFLPLWRYSMEAPQYPKGLSIDIYFDKIEGGHDGHDVNEINELNHYIGMRKIDRAQLTELDWVPFAFGVLMLLGLRAAVMGTGRSLVDLSVLFAYLSLFTLSRFVFWLYSFGHDLDPRAAINIEPFMPVIVGSKQVANFMTHSYPRAGSAIVATYALGVAFLTAWHVWAGLRRGRSSRPAAEPAATRTA